METDYWKYWSGRLAIFKKGWPDQPVGEEFTRQLREAEEALTHTDKDTIPVLTPSRRRAIQPVNETSQ